MKLLNHWLRWLVGIFMIFSGTVKAIDPIGTSIKNKEYFEVFTEYFGFLTPLWDFLAGQSLALAIFLIILEIVLGVMLLLGVYKRFTMGTMFAMIVFFTFLTGFTVFTGKVTDCGCFGDFLKLKPIETFSKDVVLTVLLIIMWLFRKYWTPFIRKEYLSFLIMGVITAIVVAFLTSYGMTGKLVIIGLMIASAFFYGSIHLGAGGFALRNIVLIILGIVATAFTFRNVKNLPIVDFRAYKIGTDLRDCTDTTGLDPGETIMKFPMEKGGEKITIKSEEYGKYYKEGWKMAGDRIDEVIREPEEPKCKDFVVKDDEEGEWQEDLLEHKGYSLWISSYDTDKGSVAGFDKVAKMLGSVQDETVKKIGMTGTSISKAEKLVNNRCTFYNLDATPIKTMNRSNPGLTVIKDGKIVGKYHHGHLPDEAELKAKFGID